MDDPWWPGPLAEAADDLVDALQNRGWTVRFGAVVPDGGVVLVRTLEPKRDLETLLAEVARCPVRIEIVADDARAVISEDALRSGIGGSRTCGALEAVRRRPEMFYGRVKPWSMPPSMVAMATSCLLSQSTFDSRLNVAVTVCADGSFTIADDGPGLPVEALAPSHRTQAEETMTMISAGPGPPGVSLALVTAMSDRSEMRTWRDGNCYHQVYEGDVAVTALTRLGATGGHGTSLTFIPSEGAMGMKASFAHEWQDQLPSALGVILRGERPGARVTTLDERTGRQTGFDC